MTDRNPPQGFEVMKKPCDTCIYRKDSPVDLKKLEDQVRDPYVGFKSFRVCHHHTRACCRGFWNRYKDDFAQGQIAQRLDAVIEVEPTRDFLARRKD